VVAADNDSKATDDLAGFVKQLRDSDAEELATVAAQWARQADPSNDRRSLLLKLSFALTLAASSQAASPDQQPAAKPTTFGSADLSGIWRSEYSYYSTSRQETFSDVHYVHVQQSGRQITIKSLDNATGSEISLDLALDGFYATGAWQERTSQAGYYKGAVYRGAIQLLVSPSLNQMAGKWLGFGKNFTINNGDWQFTLETRSTTDKTINEYKMKVLDI
jgi:hypothetical protein